MAPRQQQDCIVKIPDGGYGWVVLIASFFVSFIIDGVTYSFGIMLDEIKTTLGEREDICNLLNGFNTGFLFSSGPIVAGLANQFGCRVVVMGGGLVTAFMYIFTLYGPNIWSMLFTYGFIGGLSSGCTYIASLIVIAQYFDKRIGIATGITMAGSGVGSFILAPIIGYLIKTYDWRFTFAICACIILQTVVCGALMKPLKPVPISKVDDNKQINKNTHSVVEEDENKMRAIESYRGSICSQEMPKLKRRKFYHRNSFLRVSADVLKDMSNFSLVYENCDFSLIALSNLFVSLGYFTPFLYITKIAEENGVPAEQAAFLISVVGIVNIPARLAYGFLADRRFVSAVNLNTISSFIAMMALFFYFKLQFTFWSQVTFAVFFAIGLAGVTCLTTMYLVDLVGLEKFNNATGIVNLFRGFGCFIGPYAAGYIAEKFGKIDCFFFSAVCTAIAFVFTLAVSIHKAFEPSINDKHFKAEQELKKEGENKEVDEKLIEK